MYIFSKHIADMNNLMLINLHLIFYMKNIFVDDILHRKNGFAKVF